MTKPEFELIAIQNYLKGNENTLHFCLPLIRNKQQPEQIFFATRHSWVSRLDPEYAWVSEQEDAKTLHPVPEDEVHLAGSLIKPPRAIKLQQSVAQAGPGLLSLVKQLDADKFESLVGDFFEIEQGFKGKLLYASEYEELIRQIIDLGISVFDRETERVQGIKLTTLAHKALELFKNIITEEDRRLKAMALRLYVGDLITRDTKYHPLAQYYEQERKNNQNELQELALIYIAMIRNGYMSSASISEMTSEKILEKASSSIIKLLEKTKNSEQLKLAISLIKPDEKNEIVDSVAKNLLENPKPQLFQIFIQVVSGNDTLNISQYKYSVIHGLGNDKNNNPSINMLVKLEQEHLLVKDEFSWRASNYFSLLDNNKRIIINPISNT